MKTVAEKMGIKEGMRAIFINAPEGISEALQMPETKMAGSLSGKFDYIHLFVTKAADQQAHFARAMAHLAVGGMLWVSWPKSQQLGTDLTLPKVIEIGYENGLVESKALSVNSVWSALKFTFPKAGKVYNNSYGKLKVSRKAPGST